MSATSQARLHGVLGRISMHETFLALPPCTGVGSIRVMMRDFGDDLRLNTFTTHQQLELPEALS